MEVVDSHMVEHIASHLPSSHADIDMSGEYDDEEYIMHDAHPTADTVTDEEIYDAEIEEQTGHTEVEMGDYTDELEDDNETNMGSYVPPDDATVTDVAVEDVHLPSSPVAFDSPRGSLHHAISPHATVGADLHITTAAPIDSLSNHSPHSIATLVDDSETHPSVEVNEKSAPPVLEVVGLTTNNDESLSSTIGSSVDAPVATHEGAQSNRGTTEDEQYDDDDTPTVTESAVLELSTINQSTEGSEEVSDPAAGEGSADAVTTLHEAESAEQYDDERHSPIEEALVLNQRVRDDAADSMDPSPPVRLTYDDKLSGALTIYDVFSQCDPSSSEYVDILFDDNRTLFYDPLSVFFTRLRETAQFSGEDWQDAEMGLSINLGSYELTISEDHKQTDDVSLFKLLFISAGLGFEGPLHLQLQRYPTRFSTRYAQLIDQLEQRDLQGLRGDGIEELHEVQGDHETGEVEYERDQYEDDAAHAAEHEDEGTVSQVVTGEAPIEPHGAHSLEKDVRAQEEPEGDADYASRSELPEAVEQPAEPTGAEAEAEGEGANNPIETSNAQDGITPEAKATLQTDHIQELQVSSTELDRDRTDGDPVPNDNLYDNDEYTGGDEPDTPQQQRGHMHDGDFDEYGEEATNAAPSEIPNGTNANGCEKRVEDEYDYEEDYGADGDADAGDNQPAGDALNYDEAPTAPEAVAGVHSPTPNSRLKRNIEELEHEKYETPSAPSSPSSVYKRVRHA
ncbi:hypothetical protein BDV93DRAFT_520726 [Ceratobasidium sp. AG-I]|nr:hypothetical protein BDV93DRAFT_520726 [Ceratobasidium sp. AG-I]